MKPLILVSTHGTGHWRLWCYPSVDRDQVEWLASASDILVPLEAEVLLDRLPEDDGSAVGEPLGQSGLRLGVTQDRGWPEDVLQCLEREMIPVSLTSSGVPLVSAKALALGQGRSWHVLVLGLYADNDALSVSQLLQVRNQVADSLLPCDWAGSMPTIGVYVVMDVDYALLVTTNRDLVRGCMASHIHNHFEGLDKRVAGVVADWAVDASSEGLTLEGVVVTEEAVGHCVRATGRFGRGDRSLLTDGAAGGKAFAKSLRL